jgi:hypothetical protein
MSTFSFRTVALIELHAVAACCRVLGQIEAVGREAEWLEQTVSELFFRL